MHRQGEEVHETADEARAGSTPSIVRWVLAISTIAAIVLLSAIWIFGAATTDDEDRTANVTDRFEDPLQDDNRTDSIVSNRPEFEYADPDLEDTTTSDATATGAAQGDESTPTTN